MKHSSLSKLFCALSLGLISMGQLTAGQKPSDPATLKSMIADQSCPSCSSCDAKEKKEDEKKASEKKAVSPSKSLLAEETKEPKLFPEADQTDALAIPLDSSEAEENQEMQALENEQAKVSQKKNG